MDPTTLILALIGAAPGLITAIENLFKGNPRQTDPATGQPETDAQYAARLRSEGLAMAADTTATDSQVAQGS